MEREARHAGQRLTVGIEHRADFVEGMARIQHHDHLLAQEREHGAVAPFDAGRLGALVPLVRVAQLAQDPGGLVLQRRVHLVQRHPFGRAHREPLRPHHETDVAAAGAAELVCHHRVAQHRLAVGLRMAERRPAPAPCRAARRDRPASTPAGGPWTGAGGAVRPRPPGAGAGAEGAESKKSSVSCNSRCMGREFSRGRPLATCVKCKRRGRAGAFPIRSSSRPAASVHRARGPGSQWACRSKHPPRRAA